MFLAYEDAALLNSDMMQQIAPYYHLSLINAPIQVHIGTVDDVTPPAWSVKLQQGLLEAGKYVEFYSYEGQGHLFVGEGWLLFMERVLAFYDEQLDVRR